MERFTKHQLADQLRLCVFKEELENSPDPYATPIPFAGLSFRTQEHWLTIADAAATLLGVPLEPESDDA